MFRFKKYSILFIVFISSICLNAKAMDCVRPPETEIRNYQGQFEISAAKIMSARGPSLSTAIKTEAKSLLEKIPNADKALINLTYFYTLCTALRDDASINEREKARLVSFYSQALRIQPTLVVKNPPSTQYKSSQSSTENRRAESEKNSISITGNNAPVLNGNSIGGNVILTNPNK